MVRLKDIALRAGVSVMTVSKVLRDEPDVSAATKMRIRALAEDMGYVPNALAQSLRTRNTRLLGLVIPAITNPIFARLILAIEERAHQLGYDLILAHSLNQPGREGLVLRRMISRRVTGLLLFPVHRLDPSASIFEELRKHRIPTVILGPGPACCAAFPCVQADDVHGGYLATRHLLDLGHRRIAFLAGPPSAVWAQERFEGYQRALREADLDTDEHLVFQGGSTVEEGESAALQLLQENPGATALQAVNDPVAIGAANLLLDQGIRIPEDISVIGFGNILTSSFFRVPLSTIRQPKHSMGLAAMDLLQLILDGKSPESVRLPTSLLQRASTGRVPAQPRPTATPLPQPPPSPDPQPQREASLL